MSKVTILYHKLQMVLLIKIVPIGDNQMNAKKRLSIAFYDLLQGKAFDQITIEMIVKKSDVSKTTFYRYFKDKYELMNWYYNDNINTMFDGLEKDSWLNTSKKIMQFIYDNKQFFQSAFQVEGQNSFSNYLLEYTIAFCENRCKKNKCVETLPFQVKASIKLFCAGSLYVTKLWVNNGMVQTPSEISELFNQCTPYNIRKYLE